MGTAIGKAIDYLMTGLPDVLTPVDPDVQLVDGWSNDLGPRLFFIGREAPSIPTAETGVNAFITLGAHDIEEDFSVPCYIDMFVGGDDQAEARNAAIAVFDAFVTFLRGDLTLGGALQGGRYAQITSHSMDQTPEDIAAEGRRCLISFALRCQNTY